MAGRRCRDRQDPPGLDIIITPWRAIPTALTSNNAMAADPTPWRGAATSATCRSGGRATYMGHIVDGHDLILVGHVEPIGIVVAGGASRCAAARFVRRAASQEACSRLGEAGRGAGFLRAGLGGLALVGPAWPAPSSERLCRPPCLMQNGEGSNTRQM